LAQGLGLLVVVGASARCSSPGNTVPIPPGDEAGSGSSGDGTSGSSGDGTSGSSGDGTSGSSGSSGSTGSGTSGSSGAASSGTAVTAGDGGSCPVLTNEYLGVHIKLNVTWPSAGVLLASTGTNIADIWLFSSFTVNGTTLTGTSKTCGLTLPDVHLNGVAENKNIRLSIDGTVWDLPGMPTFPVTGKQGGFDIGSTISIDPTVGLLGIKTTSSFANVSTKWPLPNASNPGGGGTYPQFTTADLNDPDNDGMMGIPVTSFAGNATVNGMSEKFSLVPTNANYDNDVTNLVSIVSRNQIALSGTIVNDCNTTTGNATVSVFDNHVTDCKDAMGVMASSDDNCVNSRSSVLAGPGFVDNNRTMFVPGTATYKAVKVPMTATCADVRAAVP
jgi:hypothetical protein